jgi:ABC-type phosphate/phosphonate transport system substrate-binding protein
MITANRVALFLGMALLFLGLTTLGAAEPQTLRVGMTTGLFTHSSDKDAATRRDTMRNFIKSETNIANEILPEQPWDKLAQDLADGKAQIGIFEGFEFAWAQAKNAKLKPLAVAVNGQPFKVAYIVVRKDSEIANFAALQGKAFSLPAINQPQLQLFVNHECQAANTTPDKFFSAISKPDNVEDALDDVVDGKVQAAVIDRTGIDAYRRRKPGRFAKLKELTKSDEFPPPLIAYQDGSLDKATLQKFRDGLLNATKKPQGQEVLTLFKLTAFEAPPADLDRVLEATRKTYPAP